MISILIILYNKEVIESETIKSLINYNNKNIDVTIFNNGPKLLSDYSITLNDMRDKFHTVEVVQCVSNKPLSILYNDFLRSHPSSRKFVILDDDSIITNDYFLAMTSYNATDLIIPRIRSIHDKKVYYPIVNKVILEKNKERIDSKVMSIASGIILDKTIVDKFILHGLTVFDENYALYGVDTSFFKRVNHLRDNGVSITIHCKGDIIHSLSRVNMSDSKFRIIERMYDLAISTRRYPSILNFIYYSKALCLNIFNKDIFIALLIGFFQGVHPRSKNWDNKSI